MRLHACTNMGRSVCACQFHFLDYSYIARFTSGDRDHGGLLAWEAVGQELSGISKVSWPALESWFYSSLTSYVTKCKLPNLS